MNLFRVYKDNEVIAGPFASREGAFFECVTRDAGKVVERDIAGNDVREFARSECERHLRELRYPG